MMRKCRSPVVLLVLFCVVFTGCTSSDPGETPADSQPKGKSESNLDAGASQEAAQIVPGQKMMPGVAMKTSASNSVQHVAQQTQGAALVAPSGGSPDSATQGEVVLLEVGAPAPDFVSVNLAGDQIRLSDWQGKVVLLDFWATWCGPCIASFPQTQDLAAQVKDQDVVVLAVCTSDQRVAYEEFVHENGERYPDLVLTCDPHERDSESFEERASRKRYGVSGLPTQFVIGRDGLIKAVFVGHDETGERLENALEAMGIQRSKASPLKQTSRGVGSDACVRDSCQTEGAGEA